MWTIQVRLWFLWEIHSRRIMAKAIRMIAMYTRGNFILDNMFPFV